jgi:hypothetical protein
MVMFGDVQTPNESVQLYWTTEPPDSDTPRVTTLATYLITNRADAHPYLLLSGRLSSSLEKCKTGFLDQAGLLTSRADISTSESPASESYYLSALATGGSEADDVATVTQILPAADYEPETLSDKERKFEFTCEFRTEELWRSVGPSRVFDLPVVMTYDPTYEKVAEGSKGLGATHDDSEESLIIRSTANSFLTRSGAPATVDGELLKWTFKPFEVFSFSLNSAPPAGGAIWSTRGFSFGSDAGDARLQLTLLALGAMMSLLFETLWVLTKGTLRLLSGSANWTEDDEIL